jgi:hypothetical protein
VNNRYNFDSWLLRRMTTNQKSNVTATRRFSDSRIIEFRPKPRPAKKKIEPLRDPLRQWDIDEYRRRMQQNLTAATVLAVILVAGLWLFHELQTSSRTLLCVEVGNYNCLPSRPKPVDFSAAGNKPDDKAH